MTHSMRPPPPPKNDVFFASKKQELKAIEPEELTELLEDDLEEWAVGGTRILPQSMRQPPVSTQPTSQQQSFPPVAYASMPPAPMKQSSNAAVWAAVIGMTSVFAIAAIVGLVFLIRSHDEPASTETQATQQQNDTPIATSETHVEIAPLATVAPVTTNAPTNANATHATATHPATIATTVQRAKPLENGTLQTFAIANGKPVFVDGKQVGVGGSRIKTTCGKHSISVGSAHARNVDVPCNGTITVGTPDDS